ncbi:MAG: hypothetical protein JNK78_10100 [Planctomycetes bacterium]|nr:hypothetical protein [Planctomycetota bacterium]
MNRHLPRWAAAAALSLLAPSVLAQNPGTFHLRLREQAALQQLDGELWGIGPDFKAAFRPDGVEFTPALGRRAARNHPVTLRTVSVGRGTTAAAVPAAVPEAAGQRARYDRGDVAERYDVTPRGLEQSFVFDRLPAGDGDLVVRVAVETDLPLVPGTADGLRFELPEVGGVAIGGVTGIDAAGENTRGTITCDGRVVELRLPAAFVDGAALPLVLDPQIGAVFPVTSSTQDYQDPELTAPCVSGDVYLCVFEREFSATDRDIRGIRVDGSGAVTGSLFALTTGTGDDRDPTAAAVPMRSAWLAVWTRGGDLFTRSVASTGTVSNEFTAVSGANNQIEPDLGGDATGTVDDLVLVFRNSSLNAVQCSTMTLFSNGIIATSAPATLGTTIAGNNIGRPRIAHDGGALGRYLIVYPLTPGFSGNTKPQLVLIDRDVNVLATGAITNGGNDNDRPDVDGDGRNWVVVFEDEFIEGTQDNDVVAIAVWHHEAGASLQIGAPQFVTNIASVNETDPVVACFGNGSALVGWRRHSGLVAANTDLFCKTVDQLSCTTCEPTVLLANTTNIETNFAIECHPSTVNEGIVLWEVSTSSSGNGDLDAAIWDAEDGDVVTPFGGEGCGPNIYSVAGCARVGNAGFQVWVRGLSIPTSSVFVLSLSQGFLQCGPCRIYPDIYSGLVLYPVAGISGAVVGLSIPSEPALSGMRFYTQYLVPASAPLCTWLGRDVTNALSITIQ